MTNIGYALAQSSLKRFGRFAILAGLGLSLSACAQSGLGEVAGLNPEVKPGHSQTQKANEPLKTPQSELAKATEYWGKKFASNPRDAKYAVNYARNLKAMGQKRRALAVLQQASIFNGKDVKLASEYGRLALDLGQTSLGAKILAKVDNPTRPDWRVISARGAALAKQGKNTEALQYFERAIAIAPNQPSVMNNLAMAYTMDGRPAKAEALLRKAALVAKPKFAKRIQQNLALVLGLQGKYDEAKTVATNQVGAIKASADVNTIRQLVKLKPRLSPAAEAERLIKLAKANAANPKKKIARVSKKSRKRRVALRRTKVKPVRTARKRVRSTIAQASSPLLLRPTTN